MKMKTPGLFLIFLLGACLLAGCFSPRYDDYESRRRGPPDWGYPAPDPTWEHGRVRDHDRRERDRERDRDRREHERHEDARPAPPAPPMVPATPVRPGRHPVLPPKTGIPPRGNENPGAQRLKNPLQQSRPARAPDAPRFRPPPARPAPAPEKSPPRRATGTTGATRPPPAPAVQKRSESRNHDPKKSPEESREARKRK
jgi:hypothetical protein